MCMMNERFLFRRRVGLLVLLWFAALMPASCLWAQASAELQGVDLEAYTYDRWYLDTVDGQNTGYTHEWVKIDGDQVLSGYASYRVETHGGDLVESTSRTEWIETLELAPVSVTAESASGTEILRQTYRFVDGEVELTSEQGGRQTRRTLAIPRGDWLTPMGLEIAWARHNAAGDDDFELTAWDPEMGAAVVTLGYQRQGEVQLAMPDGLQAEVTSWATSHSLFQGVEMTEYRDAQGAVYGQRVSFAGLDIRGHLTDESVAEMDFDPPEMAQLSTVRPDRVIERPLRVRRAVYDLSFGADIDEDLLPLTTAHQSVERLDNGKVRVTVNLDEAQVADDPQDVDEVYLASSIMIDHTDEVVRDLTGRVRRHVGEDEDTLARSCRRFVTGHVTHVSLGVGSATASEVARNRSGDCTECSVLLAAMLRACDIPSRCVTGLVYSDSEFAGQRDVFVYHMWTQAWIASQDDAEPGRWVDLDAAVWRYTATHIALGASAMDDASAAGDMIRMIPMMDGLEIEVVEAER